VTVTVTVGSTVTRAYCGTELIRVVKVLIQTPGLIFERKTRVEDRNFIIK